MTAPAVDGRANDAVVAILADALGVRRAELAIIQGQRGRTKLVEAPDACREDWDRLLTI